MANPRQLRNLTFALSLGVATAALAIAFMLVVAAPQPAQAQTFNVLHTFTGGKDGGAPWAGLTMDGAGNLYGTASEGGITGGNCGLDGCGTVFQLKHKGSGWVFNPLYEFTGGSDGANPEARVIFGPNRTLYGTTNRGGTDGNGTVFNVRPFASVCKTVLCPWMETVLYRFTGDPDGHAPEYGDLVFDQAGNIYGTTGSGGNSFGTVYELTPSGGGWTESVLYAFSHSDGDAPTGGVILDNAGNLYGTTNNGGLFDFGTVFELTYSMGFGWSESFLYSFQNGSDGSNPSAGLIFDQSGNLYGATLHGGSGGGGTVFKLTPSSGGWTFSLVYSLTGTQNHSCGPIGKLVMDGAGNLFGTANCDGEYNAGSVFKLTPSGNSWIYTDLHDFCSYPNCSDGGYPRSNVVIDANGNLYGTTSGNGQTQTFSTVWEITFP